MTGFVYHDFNLNVIVHMFLVEEADKINGLHRENYHIIPFPSTSVIEFLWES